VLSFPDFSSLASSLLEQTAGCGFYFSGLRVLSDSWVFRVLICAEAVIGFGGGPVLKCHGRNAAECKMIKTNKTNRRLAVESRVRVNM
jgi:hypothetical protein